jgi:hypothetical protein
MKRDDWLLIAQMAAVRIAKRRGCVDADDVREVMGCMPKGVDPRFMAAVFSNRELWQRVGVRPGTRASSHKRPVTVWTLAGRKGTAAQAVRINAALEQTIAKMKKRRVK